MEARGREALAEDVLVRVGLGERLGHRPNELSGGECQRVAIARALVGEPELLLADEPTGNLDQRTGGEITQILEDLVQEGMTVVIVTHDVAKAKRAERVVQMVDGRIERELRGAEIDALVDQFAESGR
jgi:putative ABC transport system ATP-binding protein